MQVRVTREVQEVQNMERPKERGGSCEDGRRRGTRIALQQYSKPEFEDYRERAGLLSRGKGDASGLSGTSEPVDVRYNDFNEFASPK